MNVAEVYSWLTPVWSEWKKSLDAGRFPNSVIVNAPERAWCGKRWLASLRRPDVC